MFMNQYVQEYQHLPCSTYRKPCSTYRNINTYLAVRTGISTLTLQYVQEYQHSHILLVRP